MSTLTFSDLTVTYGDRAAVAGFSGRVESGEWLGLIGPNGAGKSSLLKAAVGLVDYDGDIEVDGSSLLLRSRSRRAALLAYVPQAPVLPADMSCREYVSLGRSPHITYFGRESKHDRAMVEDVLGRLDLSSFGDRSMGELSGGEAQRMVIARALATEAPVLLLDEPTSALDIGHQQQALELVSSLQREHGLTVMAAMHDLTLAGLYGDRLALMHEGTVVAIGDATEVLQADLLAEFYGVTVSVHHEPDGTVIVVPRRSSP